MCVPEGPLWAYSGVWTILSHPQSLLTLQTSAPTGWLSISGPGADREPGRLTLRVGLARARGPYSGTQAQHTPYTLLVVLQPVYQEPCASQPTCSHTRRAPGPPPSPHS